MANNAPTKAELEAKLKDNDAKIEALLAEIAELKASSAIANEKASKPKSNRKTVKFVNLTTGGFTLKGSRMYHLNGQFDSRAFSEQEAMTIINNMPMSVSNGLVYVSADADFLEECELAGIYDNLLTDEQIKGLLDNDAEDVCQIYDNACDEQKRIIVDMISEKRMRGEEVDANIMMKLGELSGKNLLGIEPEDAD